MHVILILCAVVLLFVVASMLAIYSYGRFAERARGKPSQALPLAEAGTTLDRSVGALVAKGAGPNGLAMLSNNFDAFAARARAARNAGRSLDLMYYIWHRDLTGQLLAHEVIAAADRGVRVRLILDDINAHGRDAAYLALDSHPNIEIRLFNASRTRQGALQRGLEMLFRAFSITRRMHNKAWIADGRLAIVGGRNVGDEYFGAAETANFHDLDLLLLGPAVQQAEAIFDAFWNSALALPIRALAKRRARGLARLRLALAELRGGKLAAPFLDRIRERVAVDAVFGEGTTIHWTDRLGVVSDPPEKALGQASESWLIETLYPLIVGAAETVQMTSPYFVPNEDGTAALVGLVGQGVDVAILTNSLAATDVAAVHGGYAPCRLPLLAGGVKLFELQPNARTSMSLFGSSGASLHTKAFTVDRRLGFIGSFNFDPRSAALNTEMGILFEHRPLVREMGDVFERETALRSSYRVTLADDGRLSWEAEVDGVQTSFDREPEAGLRRRLAAWIAGLLPIQSQL